MMTIQLKKNIFNYREFLKEMNTLAYCEYFDGESYIHFGKYPKLVLMATGGWDWDQPDYKIREYIFDAVRELEKKYAEVYP